jgi:hypothetical protein
VLEPLHAVVEQGGVTGARLHIDRDPVRGRRGLDPHLDMRAGIVIELEVDRAADQHMIILQRHARFPPHRAGRPRA